MKKDDLLDFLCRVVPQKGNYFVGSQKAGAKNLHQDSNLKDIIDLWGKCHARISEHRDVWYAVGNYGPTRTKADAISKRCFYIDVDCGPHKPYSTIKEGIYDTLRKLRANKIPEPSIMVVSGHGFHGYWTLTEDVSVGDWLPAAAALAAKLRELQIHVDPVVTADAARILRVPGSVNYKDPKHPIHCRVLPQFTTPDDYDFEYLASSFGMLETSPSAAMPTQQTTVDNSDLTAGTLTNRPPDKAERMLAECAMFKAALENHGANVPEPLWQNQLLALAFTEDGEDYIYTISDGHASYDKRETKRKFAQKQIRRDELDGPPRCSKFEASGATECLGCRYRGVIKNPVQLTREPEIVLPAGYSQGPAGVWRNAKDDEEAALHIFPYKIVSVQLISAGYGGTPGALHFEVQITDKDITKVEAETPVLMDSKKMTECLANANITLASNQRTPFSNFMSAWITQLNRNKSAVKPISQFGWTEHKGLRGFAVGPQVFWEDKKVMAAPVRVDSGIGEIYTTRGDIKPWKEAAARVIRHGQPEYQVALASAFAAPLMKLTGLSGALLSLMSPKSGTGKSTALQVAQAVWGDPVRGVNALNDTANAVAHKMGIVNNLPAYWDEVRASADIKQFLRLVFTVSQGKEKARMVGAMGTATMGSWATLITSASNESILAHVDDAIHGSDAGRYRIFEISLDHTGGADPVANQAFAKLKENYGHAGVRYATALARHHQKAVEAVNAEMKAATKANNPGRDERFWIAIIASLLAGASMARQLNLIDFNVKAMRDFLYQELNRHRVELGAAVKKTTGFEILKTYLHAHSPNIIKTDHIRDRVHISPALLTPMPPIAPYAAQWAEIDKVLLVPCNPFRKWMQNQPNDTAQRVESDLIKQGASRVKTSLGRGVHGLTGFDVRQFCYRLDATKVTFADLMGEAPDDSPHALDS